MIFKFVVYNSDIIITGSFNSDSIILFNGESNVFFTITQYFSITPILTVGMVIKTIFNNFTELNTYDGIGSGDIISLNYYPSEEDQIMYLMYDGVILDKIILRYDG